MTENNYTNPSYQNLGKQTLSSILDAFKRNIFLDLNAVKVGTITAYNAALQEVTVQIAFQRVTSVAPDGTQT